MGDTEEFAAFAHARSQALFRLCCLLVGDRGLAEDLLQESLTKAYVHWRRLRDPAKADAYTRKVITTTAIGGWRRRSWQGERPRDDVPDTGTPSHADDVTLQAWLWAELQTLPPRQRAAIVLRYYEDLTEAQTAEAMACTVGTVKSQVAHGLRKLRARVGPGVVLTGDEAEVLTP